MAEYLYDYLIVGSGLFGSIFAHEANKIGKRVLVLEERNHIGGNCYTENIEDINVHKYGPHIFHCNSEKIWKYINGFCEFNNFINRPKVKYKNKIYSFPINLFTLYQIYDIRTPEEANNFLSKFKSNKNSKNLEEHVISLVGKEIYEIFIKGYTEKQWGRSPKHLPKSIINRIPIRNTFDDNYYNSKYQGIPIGGYTQIFEKMLDGIEVRKNTKFKRNEYWESIAKKIVYTGPIDEFFNFSEGFLDYRTMVFEEKILDVKDYQGNAICNYTEKEIPWTRVCEHKHFMADEKYNPSKTVVTFEYPKEWTFGEDRHYPINDDINNKILEKYENLKKLISEKYIFGGRLAEYKYYDMHQVIGSALQKFELESGHI